MHPVLGGEGGGEQRAGGASAAAVSPAASSTTSISRRGDELARPSVVRSDSRRTASTAPGISGTSSR
ncbi:hypothetical protein AB0J43_36870 [Nonomuraea fuscirosea]